MPTPFLSRAQNLEDIVLWRALRHVTDGRYIDIGACDPRWLSVSRGFYEQGWRGVHFEPLPASAAKLRADRPDEPVHQIALADHDGMLTFFVSSVEGNSTGVPELAAADAPQVSVPVRTLASFGAGWAGTEVHWMKIDVEGMEAAVLRGWDARLLRPWVLVVEATRPNSTEPNHAEWEPIVLAAGYRFALFDGLNRFYVAEEHLELLPTVSIPGNIFDLHEGCRLEAWRPYLTPPAPAPTGIRRLLGRVRAAALGQW
jgi:FkbM family methyltransferase